MTWIEATAVIFGLLCVWLTVRQNVWCWPTGLVQVSLYIWVFYDVKLYSDLILHMIYVVLQLYGWHHWLRGGQEHGRLAVSTLAPGARTAWAGVTVVGSGVWGCAMASFTDAAVPYGDAVITVASLVAQWLMTRKRLESWIFWIAVDVLAIGVYWYKSLFLTAGLYAVFLGLAVVGALAWRKSLLMDRVVNEDEDRPDAGQVCAPAQGAPVGD
jgi:nicotinamide mononucleotide transporter